jgi:hypothetical protein
MIYFMQPLDGGPVKIGFSDDVETRRAQLESHYGQPLALLATMDGGRKEEQAVHSRFAHLRFGRTEQFRPAAELMTFIGRPLLVGANPNAVEAMEPASIDNRVMVIALKGSPEFRDWLSAVSKKSRIPATSIVEVALAEWASRNGHSEPPER